MDLNIFYQDNHEMIIGGAFTILGVVISWLLNFIQSHFQNKREQLIHLREKREDVYLRACDVLMRNDKCYRKQRVTLNEYEEFKNLFNELQSLMLIYASSDVYKEYYKLSKEIYTTYEGLKSRKEREQVMYINADKIEEFANKIRKELGVKGSVSSK